MTLLKIIFAKLLISPGFNFSTFFFLFVWWEEHGQFVRASTSFLVEIGNETSYNKFIRSSWRNLHTPSMMPLRYQEATWGPGNNNGNFAKLLFWENCVRSLENEITVTMGFQSTFSKRNLESNTCCKITSTVRIVLYIAVRTLQSCMIFSANIRSADIETMKALGTAM